MNNPQLTPYKFPSELETLYHQLFVSDKISDKERGISKIRSYLTKGPISHSIEITALLMESIIEDERNNGVKILKGEVSGISNNSDFGIRLQYSMIIIKFVNGLLDPFQQSMYNISLHKLAKDLKLPQYFVESRHASTHERLPSLQMIRLISKKIIDWLKVEYWDKAIQEYKENQLLGAGLTDWQNSLKDEKTHRIARENKNKVTNEDISRVENILKTIKNLRKDEIKSKIKSRNILLEINKLIKEIKLNEDFILDILIFKNYLILHGEKNANLTTKQINGVRLIWSYILEKLSTKFVYKLWIKLFRLSINKVLLQYDSSYINKCILSQESVENFQNRCEVTQSNEWILWILNQIDIINESNLNGFLEILMEKPSLIGKNALSLIRVKYSTLIEECRYTERVDKMANIMNKFWNIEQNEDEMEFEIRSIDNDEPALKKSKKSNSILFKPFENYKPVPFGCPPPV